MNCAGTSTLWSLGLNVDGGELDTCQGVQSLIDPNRESRTTWFCPAAGFSRPARASRRSPASFNRNRGLANRGRVVRTALQNVGAPAPRLHEEGLTMQRQKGNKAVPWA